VPYGGRAATAVNCSSLHHTPLRSFHHPHSHNFMPPESFHHIKFTRNASTSTLDLDDSLEYGGSSNGDGVSQKSRKIIKTKRGNSPHHRLDFNNICGINVRLNKSKECNRNLNVARSSKNIYYVRNKSDEPNIFIVDPRFHRNRKCALQKSLEDIRMHNGHVRQQQQQQHLHHDVCMNHGMLERGAKTLPRNFARPKCHSTRPSLENFLDNFHRQESCR
jgi:hypothetical protein